MKKRNSEQFLVATIQAFFVLLELRSASLPSRNSLGSHSCPHFHGTLDFASIIPLQSYDSLGVEISNSVLSRRCSGRFVP